MIGLLLSAVLAAAPAPAKPTLMVLYFENHTDRPELEVMKKGLADLLITDLVAYDGVTVVERERLESVLAELKLQQTKAFDPATRAKLGKLVGAKYLVTGAMVGVAPRFQLTATLIDATTSAAIVSTKVEGPPGQLFELEQELVGKLTAAIALKLTDPTAKNKLKAIDVDTVLAYSKGLELTDQGKLEEAQRAFAELLQRKPIFYLPRERVAALLKRMEQSAGRREDLLSAQGKKLLADAEASGRQEYARLPRAQQAQALAYKAWRSCLLMLGLRPLLAARDPQERPILRGNEARAVGLIRELFANEQALWAQVDAFSKQPGDQRFEVPPEAADVGLERVSPFSGDYRRNFLAFALTGQVEFGSTAFTVAPVPALLEPKLKTELESFFTAELGRLFALRSQAAAESASPMLTYAWTPYLVLGGRAEEAVALLQKFLDAFPSSRHFADVQEEIKVALGVEPCEAGCGHHFDWLQQVKASNASCKRGAPWTWVEYAGRSGGVPAIEALITGVEQACAKKGGAPATQLLGDYQQSAAQWLVRWDECALARGHAARYCQLETGEAKPQCDGVELKQCASAAPP